MATRSTIAVELEDGTIQMVYCHWDGYLEHNGKLLNEVYTDFAAIRHLISYGDISSLGERIVPETGDEHTFENPEQGCCVFYGRDRGEQNVEPRMFDDFFEYKQEANFEEYNYLWRDGEWLVEGTKGRYEFVPLSLELANLTETEEN